MVDGSSRLGAFVQDPAAARRARARGDVGVRVHHRVERVHLRQRAAQDQSKQTLTVWLSYFCGASRNTDWGGADGRLDADGDPGDHLLPARPAEDRVRADGRRRQGRERRAPTRLALARASCPASRARAAGLGAPASSRRASAASCLFARNVRDVAQVAELTAALRAERPDVLVATDEEGGDVTRLEAPRAARIPGTSRSARSTTSAVTSGSRRRSRRGSRAAGVNLDLAPVADVNSNPTNPVIGVRSFGADPALVARHVAAFVEGLQALRGRRVREALPRPRRHAEDSHVELPTVERIARRCSRRSSAVPGGGRGGRAGDHDRAHRRAVVDDAPPRSAARTSTASCAASSASTGW